MEQPHQAVGAGAAATIAPGLSSREAATLLDRYGPNAVAEERPHPWLTLLRKFWAPVPWMLEAAVVLEVVQGKAIEAGIIAALLLFNAVLGFSQESRAQQALALLRQRLSVQSRVRRDGVWRPLPAEALVPGDVIHVRVGDLMPADVQFADGHVLLDQ